jgi:hypothetical protein
MHTSYYYKFKHRYNYAASTTAHDEKAGRGGGEKRKRRSAIDHSHHILNHRTLSPNASRLLT